MRPSAPLLRAALILAVGVGLFLPSVRYGFVQDDRLVVQMNPATHSVRDALAAVNQPFWPQPTVSGMYRPLTVLSLAFDWQVSGGRAAWLHFMNALLNAVVGVLVMLVLARWLPGPSALVAGLVFVVHPVHVEAVATLVSRAELLAAAGILVALLAARRGWWAGALVAAAAAMLSKEHGVIVGLVILLDDWLAGDGRRLRYPAAFYGALALVTATFLTVWVAIGAHTGVIVAPALLGASLGRRLALAFPAILQAARLLVWPLDLSVDYGPQVLPIREGISLAALGGALVVAGMAWLILGVRRFPAIRLSAAAAALAYLPTANLLYPSGVVLAERNLYLPVLLVAAAAGLGTSWGLQRWTPRRVGPAAVLVILALGARTAWRLPAWRSNKTLVLTTLTEHPESYVAHEWAAAVMAGVGDTATARREYARADSLFSGDPHLDAARAYFLIGLGDTAGAAPLVTRARRVIADDPFALRSQFLLYLARGDRASAVALADSVRGRFPVDSSWYGRALRQAPRSYRAPER